ncbi:MAG: 30S ribosomal protein S9 [Tropheryma whipplei]|uniref:30S ribosomal protein S9 n=1 Tax=Tropheryma whipplei TaxID=2039 RepID=UPI0004B5F104|nr:30S ribosomal protein S9 [Tropheryma whipplei]MCO8183061.1 30S ribosomal protein S9 [Tropheryma whipplei]
MVPPQRAKNDTSSAPDSAAETRGPLVSSGSGLGRRKSATARVYLSPGEGAFVVNGRDINEYFTSKLHRQFACQPLKILDLLGSYDVKVTLHGGGASGQAGAVRLGIARALNTIDPENNRKPLKSAGFLTRDSRVKERKKAGLKKARKAPQYSKR